jgi:hypothetical protein
MEGVVPRRRDCLGESRDLEGGRSMSPKGGRREKGKTEVEEALGKDEVVEFAFLRYRRIRDGVWGPSTGTRRAMGILLI